MRLSIFSRYALIAGTAILAGCNTAGARSQFTPAEQPFISHSFGGSAVRPMSSEVPLYFFQSGSDGAYPAAALWRDPAGAFFGTTASGGASCGCGTVFQFEPKNRQEKVLYTFLGELDGQDPLGWPIADSSGALYGTTYNGGSNPYSWGTVFKLTPSGSGYTESLLYRFQGGADGANPNGSLITDTSGQSKAPFPVLYGTTDNGGTSNDGTVFKLKLTGSTYTESILYTFAGGQDGAVPRAELLRGRLGNLYGTTLAGGGGPCALTGTPPGCGTVFELKRSKGWHYTETVLYRFQGGKDGANPYGGLIAGPHGALFGTTGNGGSRWCRGGDNGVGCGTIFKLTPSGSGYTESVIHRFRQPEGRGPGGDLTIGPQGELYGTAGLGGAAGVGVVFSLRPSGSRYLFNVLYDFQGSSSDGAFPSALIYGKTGALYGTTNGGGTSNYGTVFRFNP